MTQQLRDEGLLDLSAAARSATYAPAIGMYESAARAARWDDAANTLSDAMTRAGSTPGTVTIAVAAAGAWMDAGRPDRARQLWSDIADVWCPSVRPSPSCALALRATAKHGLETYLVDFDFNNAAHVCLTLVIRSLPAAAIADALFRCSGVFVDTGTQAFEVAHAELEKLINAGTHEWDALDIKYLEQMTAHYPAFGRPQEELERLAHSSRASLSIRLRAAYLRGQLDNREHWDEELIKLWATRTSSTSGSALDQMEYLEAVTNTLDFTMTQAERHTMGEPTILQLERRLLRETELLFHATPEWERVGHLLRGAHLGALARKIGSPGCDPLGPCYNLVLATSDRLVAQQHAECGAATTAVTDISSVAQVLRKMWFERCTLQPPFIR